MPIPAQLSFPTYPTTNAAYGQGQVPYLGSLALPMLQLFPRGYGQGMVPDRSYAVGQGATGGFGWGTAAVVAGVALVLWMATRKRQVQSAGAASGRRRGRRRQRRHS